MALYGRQRPNDSAGNAEGSGVPAVNALKAIEDIEAVDVVKGNTAFKASKAFNIIVDGENRLFWYLGMPHEALEPLTETNYSADGIRKVLLEKNSTIQDMVVLIKPTSAAVYKNVVDILDEMNISNIKRYALIDITPDDLEELQKLKQGE